MPALTITDNANGRRIRADLYKATPPIRYDNPWTVVFAMRDVLEKHDIRLGSVDMYEEDEGSTVIALYATPAYRNRCDGCSVDGQFTNVINFSWRLCESGQYSVLVSLT